MTWSGDSNNGGFATVFPPWARNLLLISFFLITATVSSAAIYLLADSLSILDIGIGWLITSITLGTVVGLALSQSINLLLSSRQRMLGLMALGNLKRRKRNTSLVLVGLLVGSAIITSSLVVGDSLDATLQAQFAESLDETDIIIRGRDGNSQPIWWNESRARGFLDDVYSMGDVDAVSLGILTETGLKSPEHRTVEANNGHWLAMDPTYQEKGSWNPFGGANGPRYSEIEEGKAYISEKGADHLKVAVGDLVEASWTTLDSSGQMSRSIANFTIQAIVPTHASGYENGGEVTIYTTLQQAQEVQGRQGEVNRLTISATGGVLDAQQAERRVLPLLNSTLDEAIVAEDTGLVVTTLPEDATLSVQKTEGDALLSGDDVASLRQNISAISPNASIAELLMAPLLRLTADGVNLSGLISDDVSNIDSDSVADWYATPAGLSVQMRETSQWFQWTPSGNGSKSILEVVSVGGGAALSLHSSGVRLSVLDAEVPSRDITMPVEVGELTGLAVSEDGIGVAVGIVDDGVQLLWGDAFSEGAEVWEPVLIDTSSLAFSIEDAEVISEADSIYLNVAGAFAAETCEIAIETLNTETIFCNWISDPPSSRGITSLGGVAWDLFGQDLQLVSSRLVGNTTSAHTMGLPAGDITSVTSTAIFVEGGGLYLFDGETFTLSPIQPPPSFAGGVAWSDGNRTITSAGVGVHISDDRGVTGRIPYQVALEGGVNYPLIALSLTGGIVPEPLSGDVFLTSWSAAGLAMSPPSNLSLVGIYQAVAGDIKGLQMNHTYTVPELPAPPGQPGLDDISVAIVNLSDAEILVNRDEPVRSMVMVSDPSLAVTESTSPLSDAISDWVDEVATAESMGLKVTPIKSQIRERTADSGANFSALFLIFGTFVIFAGILLVMNLFVMLADERKSEMGMLRALGMQRRELRSMFVMEGTLIGLLSSAIGSLAGIGVAWLLMATLDKILSRTFSGSISFDWTWHSILTGFSFGFLVTFLTLWMTSLYISRMNVVAAMRNIPTRLTNALPWWTILVTLALMGATLVCAFAALFIGDEQSGSASAWWLAGGFLFLFSLVPPLFFILSKLLPESVTLGGFRASRSVLTPRLTMSILGLLMFGWGVWDDPVSADWEQGDVSFIILGAFLVAAGVLLLTSLAPVIAKSLARAGSTVSRRLSAVLPTALAYPLATPFRTAMTMGMFSLVVFAVVVLSGYSALVGNWLGDLGEDARGEWEIVAFGNLDLDEDSGQWELGSLTAADFDAIATMEAEVVKVHKLGEMDLENNSRKTMIRGFDANFSDFGGLPLHSWESSLGATESEVWSSILENDSLAVIDYSMAVESYQGEGGVEHEGMGLNIGDALIVSDPFNPARNSTFYVAAVTTQESGWFASGVSVNREVAAARFDTTPSSIWFSLPPEADLERQDEVAKELQYELVEEGAVVFAIEVEFKEIQSFIFSMFQMLQAFLALGLAVGIAGLGVITIRNVSERTHQIGILRALGFQRSMVVTSFLTELTWVSLLGILNGAAVGIGFHYQLYVKFLKAEGAEFVIPVGEILFIILGAYLLTLLATAWPVRRAASIHPAEALRDIE